MKKPTKEEWLKHHTEMQLLAKQEALRNRYIFDPKTKLEFVKPRSITMLDEMKKPTIEEWVAHATQSEQLTLDLTAPKVIWRVQVGRYTKGCYQTKCSMESAAQAIRYYHAVNVGRGYKKRLIKEEGGKTVTVAKQTS